MPAGVPPRSVVDHLLSVGPFNPNARLDPSQVVDMALPPMMDYRHFEDGSAGFVPALYPGFNHPVMQRIDVPFGAGRLPAPRQPRPPRPGRGHR